MVKFGKNKLKVLNKLAKKQSLNARTSSNSINKVLKKKQVAEKKVSFQKEVLLKQAVTDVAEGNSLVKNVKINEILSKHSKKKAKLKKAKPSEEVRFQKVKSVEKQKKRQKTLVNDTKLLLKMMSKK